MSALPPPRKQTEEGVGDTGGIVFENIFEKNHMTALFLFLKLFLL